MEKTYFEWCCDYSDLGYDISLTSLYGKEAIRMVKRYSHKREGEIVCEQICCHENLKDLVRLHEIIQFLYEDIQRQAGVIEGIKSVEK